MCTFQLETPRYPVCTRLVPVSAAHNLHLVILCMMLVYHLRFNAQYLSWFWVLSDLLVFRLYFISFLYNSSSTVLVHVGCTLLPQGPFCLIVFA